MHNSTKINNEDTFDTCGELLDDGRKWEGKWMLKNESCKYFVHKNDSLTIITSQKIKIT